jgi:hypothetical protein
MVRRRRQWVAGLMMLGVVFAQIVTAAHACTLAVPTSQAPTAVVQSADEAMPLDCTTMAKRVAASVNVCESHCGYGQQIDVHPDVPMAGLAPQAVLTVHALLPLVPDLLGATSLFARSTAPPVSILFSRFLI